jgi:uncharacterized membrane protein
MNERVSQGRWSRSPPPRGFADPGAVRHGSIQRHVNPADRPPQVAARPGAREILDRIQERDPYLAPQLIVLAAIVLDLSLPEKLTIGPTWLLPTVEALLLLGLVIASPRRGSARSPRRRHVAIGLIGLVSAVNVVSLYLLVHFLLRGHKTVDPNFAHDLILAGVVLWITNVLLFGLWYWELDRGGAVERGLMPDARPDFLFPQMADPKLGPEGWCPGLLDYLYVSFTNATAFSPTDAMPLTQTAKLLMSVQALTSLVTVGLVVARAVNILN